MTVNYVADRLGLVGNSMECTTVSTNKYFMRKRFAECSISSPKCHLIDADVDVKKLNLEYPVIVKPTDRSGSRGIFKIETQDDIYDAIKEAIDVSFEKKL